MEARIQFRINENTKRLAQLSAERKGMTLSDAFRHYTNELAEEQLALEKHDAWLEEQVELAYDKIDMGKAEFISNDDANAMMQRRLNKLRAQNK